MTRVVRGGLTAALAVLLALLIGACGTVKEPDPEDWDESARVSLDDASSQLATTRMILTTRQQDETWHGYAVVVLADAEQAAGKDADSMSALQPPPERSRMSTEVTDLLTRASDLVEQARLVVVAHKMIDPRILKRLQTLGDRLDAEVAMLR
jgi:hypothetical protein